MTGLRINNGWLHAVYEGSYLAGMTLGQAQPNPRQAREWLYTVVQTNWGASIAALVRAGGIVVG